ncbi:MAG: hypothetical protein GY953_45790, partial [bacterium]|nr:hypothetical protein [bacterium]
MAFRFLLYFLLATVVFVPTLSAVSVDGDWNATLQAGPATLRLAVHIVKSDTGELSATMDSLDQGAMGLEIDSIVLEGNKLDFKMTKLMGAYVGTVSADGQSIAGTWTQGPNSFPLKFERAGAAGADEQKPAGLFDDPALARVTGIWSGRLMVEGQSLRVVLNIERQEQQFRVTMESPDQSKAKIPVSSISVRETAVEFGVPSIGGSYSGTMDEKATKLTGTWTQGPGSFPLVLDKAGKA